MRRRTYLSKTKYISERKAEFLTDKLESGVVTVFWSKGIDPLKFWSKNNSTGSIKRVTSDSIGGLVMEITSPAFCETSITLPEHPMEKIGTSLPVLNLMVEYLNRPFCFEIQVRDSKNMKRIYRMSTCQKRNTVDPLLCHMSLNLISGWNKIQLDLMSLTKLSYRSCYVELLKLQINANCRLRWAYFSDRKYEETELPEDFRLMLPRPKFRPDRIDMP